MKLVFISDTHGKHELFTDEMPEGDFLFHCGDFCNSGAIYELVSFNLWLEKIKDRYKHIVCIAGNHDRCFEDYYYLSKDILKNCIYLQDESIKIENINIYGSPWSPRFFNWAFNLDRDGVEIERKWSFIPENVDILLSHTPPNGIKDYVSKDNFHAGCKKLFDRITQVKPKIHAFGHIHNETGSQTIDGTLFLNASCLNDKYKKKTGPHIIEINKDFFNK